MLKTNALHMSMTPLGGYHVF